MRSLFFLISILLLGMEISPKEFSFKVEVNDVFTTRDIHFELGKTTLDESSYPLLDSIAEVLQNHDSLIIEIGQHTDYVNPVSSTAYTQRRGEAIAKYLIAKGIKPGRLSVVGYGDTKNLKENDNPDGTRNEENRSFNRRTEFKVIGIVHPK